MKATKKTTPAKAIKAKAEAMRAKSTKAKPLDSLLAMGDGGKARREAKMKGAKPIAVEPGKPGRKKIGEPISVTVTIEQREWLDAQIPAGGTRTAVIRALIEKAMDAEMLGV